MLSGVVGVRG